MLENSINNTANNSFTNTFTNNPVDTQLLPTLIDLKTQPLSPTYSKTNLVLNIFSTLLVSILIYTAIKQPFFALPDHIDNLLFFILCGIICLGGLITLYYWLADPLKSYRLREHDISYCSGLFFKKTVTQPILRIQHIELKRGPIESKVGLATLQVFSAGGALETFEIPGLPVEDAQKIREFILQNTGVLQHG